MENRITYDRIKFQNPFGLNILHNLQLQVQPNDHARLTFSGIVDAETGVSEIEKQLEGRSITVEITDDEDKPAPLFSGFTQAVTISRTNEIYYIEGTLISGTYLLDLEKKSRSFQDINMTYQGLVKQVVDETPEADVICTVGKEETIGKPLIQYNETDWEFIKRLASHFGSYIIPEITLAKPRFWFGMRNNNSQAQLPDTNYQSIVSDRYYALGGAETGQKRADYIYHIVQDSQNRIIGDKVSFQQRENLIISQKHASMEKGQLIFTYYVGPESINRTNKYYNEKISGMSLLGSILATKNETVKMHLDIDQQQDQATAYPYNWTPATGNLIYCMPQVGTRASLYFSSQDEHSAQAVNCVRTNGSSCDKMADPNQRYLTTEHGKQLQLLPDSMGLVGGENMQIQMHNDLGILLQSPKILNIYAKGPITFQAGKSIYISAPLQITLATLNASINANNQFDIIGQATKFLATVHNTYPNFDDEPKETEKKKFPWGKLIGHVVAGLAVVGAVAFTIGTLGAGAPLVIGALAVGGSLIAGQAISDIQSGEVSDIGVYVRKGFLGALAGAVGGAASEGLLMLLPESMLGSSALATITSRMIAGGGAGAVATLVENTILGQKTTRGELIFNTGLSALTFGLAKPLTTVIRRALGKGVTKTISEGVENTQPATVNELIDMMNKRESVTAKFAEGDELEYLIKNEATGSHMLMEDGTSSILLREDVATRWDAFHEYMHHVLQSKNGSYLPGEDEIIENFLKRHEELFKIESGK